MSDSEKIIEELIENHRNIEVKIKLWEKDGVITVNSINQISQFIKHTEIEFNEEFNKYRDLLGITPDLQHEYLRISKIVTLLISATKDIIVNEKSYMKKTNSIINTIIEDNKYEPNLLKTVLAENVSLRSQVRQSEEMLTQFMILDESKKKVLRKQMEDEENFLDSEKEVETQKEEKEENYDFNMGELSEKDKEALRHFDDEEDDNNE